MSTLSSTSAKTTAKRVLIEDALRHLDRAAAALKEAGEPMAAMKVSAIRGTFSGVRRSTT